MTTPSVTGAGKGIEVGNSSATVDTGAFSVSGSSVGVFAICLAGAGSPALPTSVAWDPTGVNESMTLIQSVAAFNTFWIAGVYGKIAPTAKSAVVRATWASAPDEGLVVACGVQDMDQTNGWRTPLDTQASGSGTANPITSTLNVTSQAADRVLGFGCNVDTNTGLTTISSATLTIPANGKLEGADGTSNEQLALGSVTAAGTSTTVSFAFAKSVGDNTSWVQFGLSLIPAAGGGGGGGAASAGTLLTPSDLRAKFGNLAGGFQ